MLVENHFVLQLYMCCEKGSEMEFVMVLNRLSYALAGGVYNGVCCCLFNAICGRMLNAACGFLNG